MADPTKDVALLRAVLQRVLDSQSDRASTLSHNQIEDIRGALEQTAPPKKWFMVPMFACIDAESAEEAEQIVSDRFQEHSRPGQLLFQDDVIPSVEFDYSQIEPASILDFDDELRLGELAAARRMA